MRAPRKKRLSAIVIRCQALTLLHRSQGRSDLEAHFKMTLSKPYQERPL